MKEFYAYIDISNPLVAWEAAIGRICSASKVEDLGVSALSIRHFALFKSAVKNNNIFMIEKELEIEELRYKHYPDKVSRLRGVYFFESQKQAITILGREGWRSSRFNEKYLSKVNLINGNISNFDSEWITSEFNSKDSSWVHSYLAGETYGISPITEVIADGVGKILNEKLKKKAFRYIAQNFPGSMPCLVLARLAFDNGFLHAGQVVPFLLRKTKNEIEGVYILNTNDFEKESDFIKLLNKGFIKKPVAPAIWDGKWQTPDFRSMGFKVKIS